MMRLIEGPRNSFQAKENVDQVALLRAIFCVLFLGTFLVSCAKAPITGRTQLILISPEVEKGLGLKTAQEILGKEPIERDPALNAMLVRVGSRIAQAAGRPDFEWEFHLIKRDDVVNAFCLPGGKVFVYTGVLKYTKDECGLATVIGHEVAHALARHGAERMSLALLSRVGETALEATLSTQGPQTVQTFRMLYGLVSNVGVILPYSRKQEFEADYIGLMLMAKAGYNPMCALFFWDRMKKSQPGRPIFYFLATHPTDEARIERLRMVLPRAMEHYNSALK